MRKMFGRNAVATAVLAVAPLFGAAGTAVSPASPTTAEPESPAETEVKGMLRDHRGHVGEQARVYGFVYSDAAVWTLAFLSGAPEEYYTINGSRAQVVGTGGDAVRQGDVFTGTITLTGKDNLGDPVVLLDEVTVIGHGRE